MAKKTGLSKFNQPVHPALSIIVICLILISGMIVLVLRSRQNSILAPQQYLTHQVPSATPIPEVNIFKISGSGKSSMGTEHGKPVPPLYFEKTITDPAVVQKLYNAMLALPPYPTPVKGLTTSCGISYFMHYSLGFYKDSNLIQNGTMSILPCGGGRIISLEGSYKQEFGVPTLSSTNGKVLPLELP